MTYPNSYLLRVRWGLLLILLFFAPFHAFLITLAKSLLPGGALISVLSAWREIFVLGICAIIFFEGCAKKTFLREMDALDWCIIAFSLLALAFLPFQKGHISQWLLGVRFDVMPFVFLFFVRRAEWGDHNNLRKIALGAALVVVAFGLLHALILPQNFLEHFGYSDYQGQYRPDIPISACQYLEGTDRVCRAISTFGGPTRYGTYLLLVLGLLFGETMEQQRQKANGKWQKLLFIMLLVSVVLTYSRSIWIGALIMGIFGGIFLFRSREKKVSRRFLRVTVFALVGLVIVGGLALWQFRNVDFFKTIFVRNFSSSEHFYLARQGIATALSHPLGLGLGVSGPATFQFQKSLTENWFIQIAVEMGALGLALFCALLVLLSKKLLSEKNDWQNLGLFLSLLGISVAGLFTHSFEETSTMLLFAVFAGIALGQSRFHQQSS